MSTDPFGPDSPLGENHKNPESSPGEDFLGLEGGLNETDSASALEEETLDAPLLDTPTEAEFSLDDLVDETSLTVEGGFAESEAPQPFDSLEHEEPLEPMESLEPMDSLNSLETLQGEESAPFAPEADEALDFAPEEGFEGSEEDDGWLMEFEIDEDELQDEAFVEAAQASADTEFNDDTTEGSEGESVDPYDDELQPTLAPPTANPWLARALIAAVSVFLGVVGSKFVPFGDGGGNEIKPRVAQGPKGNQPKPTQPATGTGTETTAQVEPTTPDTNKGGPAQTPTPENNATSDDPSVATSTDGTAVIDPVSPDPTENVGGESDGNRIEIDWQGQQNQGDWARDGSNTSGTMRDGPLLPEELGSKLREASPRELAGMWSGAAIPVEAIAKEDRLLTPNVGRVRVILADGEIFEGELYAVGEKRVWIETNLGKMALLEWQIDRVEHIVSDDGAPVIGRDGSRDLAGLKSVRVSTAGGVFYGKLLSQEGNEVTLVTEAGGRITLQDAKVDSAGKSATSLVDSSGAIEELETPEDE